ncbi:MAG: outer membrane lipoprotein-sorting protein [bacterium]|nr:outer membrane lipoprotein-sorting protein [bacterium]
MIGFWFGGLLALTLALSAVPSPIAAAEELDGRAIMERVDARDDGDTGTSDTRMVLIDKRGKKRERNLRSFFKDFGEDTHQVLFFLSPADVKDTGFLTYDYDGNERDDDQWLYLPALQKTKRIAGGDKSGSFMGSDFTYADLSDRPLDSYDYELMKEVEVGGVMTWQVEAIPNNEKEVEETGNSRSIYFVRQDNFMVVRSVSWTEKRGRLKYMEVTKLEQIDGIWTAIELQMTTKKGKKTLHKTELFISKVRFNQELGDELFTVRGLEKGL